MDQRINGLWLLLGGFGSGAILGSGIANRWGDDISALVTSPNFATLLAGLGGAIIGGFISYLTSRQTAALALARDNDQRTASENASALNVQVTTLQVANRLFTFLTHLENAISDLDGEEPWQRFQASPEQDASSLRYKASDFIPFINAKGADLVHRCFLLSDRYDSIEASHRAYSRLRLELEELLVPHSVLKDGSMETNLPDDLRVRAQYLMGQLNGLIKQMHEYCKQDLDDAKKLIEEMNGYYKSYFGDKANFTFAFDDHH